jgi:twitching motility protein PilT
MASPPPTQYVPIAINSPEPGLKVAASIPGEPQINQLFRTVMLHKGSDLHLKAGLPGMMRLRGVIQKMNTPVIEQDTMEKLIFPIMKEKDKKVLEDTGGADFAHVIGKDEARYRVNVLKQRGKLALVARLVNSTCRPQSKSCATSSRGWYYSRESRVPGSRPPSPRCSTT